MFISALLHSRKCHVLADVPVYVFLCMYVCVFMCMWVKCDIKMYNLCDVHKSIPKKSWWPFLIMDSFTLKELQWLLKRMSTTVTMVLLSLW